MLADIPPHGIYFGTVNKPGATLQLQKGTVLQSARPAGNTALLEWIAALGGHDSLARWRRSHQGGSTRLEVRYDAAGRRHRLEFTFNGYAVDYVHDGQILHSPPSDLAVIHMKETAYQRRRQIDDIEAISEGLGVDPHIIRNLTGEIARNGPPDLRLMRFVDEEETEWDVHPERETPYTALHVCINAHLGEQYFGTLSGSETQRVLIEFACALARERTRSAPTLLLLDGSGWSFDEPYMAEVAAWLLKQPFQTIMTLNDHRHLDDDPVWKAWGQVVLDRPQGSKLTSII